MRDGAPKVRFGRRWVTPRGVRPAAAAVGPLRAGAPPYPNRVYLNSLDYLLYRAIRMRRDPTHPTPWPPGPGCDIRGCRRVVARVCERAILKIPTSGDDDKRTPTERLSVISCGCCTGPAIDVGIIFPGAIALLFLSFCAIITPTRSPGGPQVLSNIKQVFVSCRML